jgi:hypothetical protein
MHVVEEFTHFLDCGVYYLHGGGRSWRIGLFLVGHLDAWEGVSTDIKRGIRSDSGYKRGIQAFLCTYRVHTLHFHQPYKAIHTATITHPPTFVFPSLPNSTVVPMHQFLLAETP